MTVFCADVRNQAAVAGALAGADAVVNAVSAYVDRGGAFEAVHVAGTNGKGSVCAMVESIARAAGSRSRGRCSSR